MKLNKLLLLGCLPFLFASCSNDDESANEPDRGEKVYISLSMEQRSIKKKSIEFANRLLANVVKENENTLLSPLGLQVVLGVMSNGANEQVYNEMVTTLGLQDHSLEELNHYHQTIMYGILTERDPNVTLALSNAFLKDKDFRLKQTFIDKIQEDFSYRGYYALHLLVSYLINAVETNKTFSSWVEGETKGMITDVQVPIDASSKFVLFSICSFKGQWASSFDEKNTVAESFTAEDGITQTVPMMHGIQNNVSYTENDNYQFASLDFGNGSFSLALALPKEGKSVSDIISSVDWDTDNATAHDVKLVLPKFKLETAVSLNEILQNMGIQEAFKENSFPGIADECCFTHVQQNLAFEIDESGVEKSPSMGTADISMTLNRPFLFAIRENSSGALLYMGKIASVE